MTKFDLVKMYYKLTGFMPRMMPTTKDEIDKLKQIFTNYFGVEDNHQVWYTIFSNIGSIRANKTTISYQSLANIAKRLDINKLLQDQKQFEYESHLSKLEKEKKNGESSENGISEVAGSSNVPEGPHDIQPLVQSVQES